MKYSILFTVSGKSKFPADMLRYDCCYPADTTSALGIVNDSRTTRKVTLRRHIEASSPTRAIIDGLTPRRWESFGWSVDVKQAERID